MYIGTTIEFVKLRALISGFYEFKCNSTVTKMRVTHSPSRVSAQARGKTHTQSTHKHSVLRLGAQNGSLVLVSLVAKLLAVFVVEAAAVRG